MSGERAEIRVRDDAERVSAWAPLALPVFRSLWLAQLGSNVGVWMQTVGAQWFLVEESHSSALVAWVQTASLLPTLLLSLLAGVFADRYDRRLLLIWTNGAATVLAAALTVCSYAGVLTPWTLLLFTFLIGCASALTTPAWQAIQPELVPREQLTAASALGGVTVNAARAVGPAIAGVLVALTGPALVFALNAASFVLVIVALARWRRQAETPADPERLGRALVAGVRYIRSGPVVRRILLRAGLFALPASALWSLLPDAARQSLGLGAGGYGLLLAALGVGALLGVALMPTARRRLSTSTTLAASAVVFALGTVAVVWWPLAAVLPLFVVAGCAWTMTLTTLNASMQLSLAAWVRARGMAFYVLVFMGVQAVGSFLWGALSSTALGTDGTLLLSAGLLLLCAASVPLLPLRPETGTLDRGIVALCAAAPTLVFEPDPQDGPVLVVRDYRVPAEHAEAFTTAMREVEGSRRRTGASSWRLYRSGEHADGFREEFTVRSWSEFRAQGTSRWTAADDAKLGRAVALADGEITEEHFFAARSG